jgi:hypothetical protein
MTEPRAVPFAPAQIEVFEARAHLLSRGLQTACSKVKRRGALYPTEIESLGNLASALIAQLMEVENGNVR